MQPVVHPSKVRVLPEWRGLRKLTGRFGLNWSGSRATSYEASPDAAEAKLAAPG